QPQPLGRLACAHGRARRRLRADAVGGRPRHPDLLARRALDLARQLPADLRRRRVAGRADRGGAPAGGGALMPATPTLEHEQALWADASLVIGMDEVGRGALAGPVSVGALALAADCGAWPEHLRDSKTMTPLRRASTAPLVREWGVSAVGHASNDEIDRLGIQIALGLAGRRALVALHAIGIDVPAAAILLDGTHDWLAPALRAPIRTTLRAKAD